MGVREAIVGARGGEIGQISGIPFAFCGYLFVFNWRGIHA